MKTEMKVAELDANSSILSIDTVYAYPLLQGFHAVRFKRVRKRYLILLPLYLFAFFFISLFYTETTVGKGIKIVVLVFYGYMILSRGLILLLSTGISYNKKRYENDFEKPNRPIHYRVDFYSGHFTTTAAGEGGRSEYTYTDIVKVLEDSVGIFIFVSQTVAVLLNKEGLSSQKQSQLFAVLEEAIGPNKIERV